MSTPDTPDAPDAPSRPVTLESLANDVATLAQSVVTICEYLREQERREHERAEAAARIADRARALSRALRAEAGDGDPEGATPTAAP